MAKKNEQDKRLQNKAKAFGISTRDLLEALMDYLEGQITDDQLLDPDFLKEKYFTPSTYKLFAEFNRLRLDGRTKKQALDDLKVKYPRASTAQWKAVKAL